MILDVLEDDIAATSASGKAWDVLLLDVLTGPYLAEDVVRVDRRLHRGVEVALVLPLRQGLRSLQDNPVAVDLLPLVFAV